MASDKTWKWIERAGYVVVILTFVFDLITNKFGFVIPLLRFLWNILNQNIPVFIVVILGIVFFVIAKGIGRKLTEKDVLIISFLDEGERGLGLLFRAYKKVFPAESRTMSKCMATLQKLEKRKLIKVAALTGGTNAVQDELFKLTKKGLKRYRKFDAVLRERGSVIFDELTEQPRESEGVSRIEPHEEVKLEELILDKEHMLILGILGVVKGDVQDESLYKEYLARNPEKSRLHFKFVIDDLKQKGLIEICLNVIGDNSYVLSPKGLAFLRKIVDMKKEEDPKAEM